MSPGFHFVGYRFTDLVDKEGSTAVHDGQHHLYSKDQFLTFIVNSVEKYPEIRVTDMLDCTVYHVCNQSLIFPLPSGYTTRNRWNPLLCQFEEPSAKDKLDVSVSAKDRPWRRVIEEIRNLKD